MQPVLIISRLTVIAVIIGSIFEGRLLNATAVDDVSVIHGVAFNPHTAAVSQSSVTIATSVAAGGSVTCVTNNRGGVQCWGDSNNGLLGNGGIPAQSINVLPVDVSDLQSGVRSITAGVWRVCAILQSTSGLKCWGFLPSSGGSIRPTDVVSLTTDVSAVSIGANHACAITILGAAKCWGDDSNGQIGDGAAIAPLNVPGDVISLTSGVTSIAAGANFSCAVVSSGQVKCWGRNTYRELGSVGVSSTTVPTDVVGISNAVSVVAGINHACALIASGGVKCWGWNHYGQIGDSAVTNVTTAPVSVLGLSSGVTAITAGDNHNCALLSSGQIRCWGLNQFGQLGDATTTNALIPVNVIGLPTGIAEVTAASNHTCIRTTTGETRCWGNNASGQLGIGSALINYVPQVNPYLASGVADVSVGTSFACALMTAGGVKCWGTGILGDGNASQTSITPVDVVNLTSSVKQVVTGPSGFACAVTTPGAAKCWGTNHGQNLGSAIAGNALVPTDVVSLTSGVQSIVLGGGFNPYEKGFGCALLDVGAVKCWGSINNSPVPSDVVGLSSGVTKLAAGATHACALITTIVKCWGSDTYGALGNGTGGNALITPTLVAGLTDPVIDIAAGGNNGCALLSDHTVRCWGANESGQLGDGTKIGSQIPVAMTGLGYNVEQISISGGRLWTNTGAPSPGSNGDVGYACARMQGGAILCWGRASEAELGTGTAFESLRPAPVRGLDSGVRRLSVTASMAAATSAYLGLATPVAGSCAVTEMGGVVCWGNMTTMSGSPTYKTLIQPAVNLDSGDYAVFEERSAFQTLAPGAATNVYFRLRNLGTTTWTDSGYGWHGYDAWDGVTKTLSVVVPPGQSTIPIYENVNAPGTAGVYNYSARLANAIGNEFGPYLYTRIVVTASSTATPTITPTPNTPTPTATSTPTSATNTPTPVTPIPTTPVPPSITPTPTTAPAEPAGIAVLVHGWQGLSLVTGTSFTCDEGTPLPGIANIRDDFGNIKTLLEQNGWRVYFAHYETKSGYTAPIDVSAACLSNRIDAIVKKENGRKVTIIAHSMGGIVARQYVDKPVQVSSESNWSKVDHLITLGSPHWGINLGVLRYALALARPELAPLIAIACLTDPGTCELAADKIAVRNFFNQTQPTGDYYFVGGSGKNISGPLQPGLQQVATRTEGINDGFVGQRSSIGYAPFVNVSLGSPKRYKTGGTHVRGWGQDQSYFDGIETECILKDILKLTKHRACPNTSAANAPEQIETIAETENTSSLPTIADTLQPGVSKTYAIAVDGNEMTLLLAWNTGGLDLQLTAPSGITYTQDSIASAIPGAIASASISTDSLSSISYIIPAPQAGIWQATIRSTNNAISSPFVLLGAIQSTINLSVDSIAPISSGSAAKFLVRLTDAGKPLAGAAITTTLTTSSGIFAVKLKEEAPGTYSASSVITDQPGQYFVSVEASGITPISFKREGIGLLEIFLPKAGVSVSATFAALNTDGANGLDVLRLTAPLSLPATDRYALTLEVVDSLGTSVTNTQRLIVSPPESTSLTLDIPGSLIRQHGINGPYSTSIKIIKGSDLTTAYAQSDLARSIAFKVEDFGTGYRVYLPFIRR